MSYVVRCFNRSSSSSFPWECNSFNRSSSSCWIPSIARSSWSSFVMKWVAGKIATWFRSPKTSPVNGSISRIRSISSPKNSTRSARSSCEAGKISTTSPWTRNRPRWKSISLRSYWISTNDCNNLSRSISWPTRSEIVCFWYSNGLPNPKIDETDATTITSLRSNKALVAECRNLSISSLMLESFSMYVSLEGTYASGW